MVLEKSKYIVSIDYSIKQALVALNNLSTDVLTLFVVDNNNKLLGTITDGDIRRSLVNGISISDNISKVLERNFSYIREGENNLFKIKSILEKGIKLLPEINSNKEIIKIYNLKKYKSFLPIDAVLMAGGKGERLRPLTEKTPKPLLKVGNKSIIDYNIERLTEFGVENISVTINYLADQIETHFSLPINSVQVKTVREPEYLGTIGSVNFVKDLRNDTVLVMNSDLFTNINYEDFYLHFINNNADMSVAAVPYSVNIPYGIFELNENKIIGIKEKPSYNYYANAGIYLIKREILNLIPKNKFFNATDLIDLLISNGKKVVRFPLVGYWIDIGKPVDFQKAQDFVKHLR